MNTPGFLYRQKQKVKYHTAKTDFDKLVAEINRNHQVVDVTGKKFSIEGIEEQFDIGRHAFMLDKLYVLRQIISYAKGRFLVEYGEIFFLIDHFKLKIETAEELFIINEVFFENCYNFIVANEEVIVIDIGMNVGFASLFMANKPNVRKVYAFEPFSKTYEAALANFANNPKQAKKILAHNYGLGDTNEKIHVPYSGSDRGKNQSITLNQPADSIADAAKVAIDIKDTSEVIAKVLEENGDASIYIKMDCEGAEFAIFDVLAKTTLAEQIKGMMIEWHFKEPDGIIQFLQDNSFKMIKTNLGPKSGLIYAFR